jgi:hypothetical protein
MSAIALNEIYILQELRDIEILSDLSGEEEIEILIKFSDGTLRLKIPDEFPELPVRCFPNFLDFNDKTITTLLHNISFDNDEGMIEKMIDEMEQNILPDLRSDKENSKIVQMRKQSELIKTNMVSEEPVSLEYSNNRSNYTNHSNNKSNDKQKSKNKMKVFIHEFSTMAYLFF